MRRLERIAKMYVVAANMCEAADSIACIDIGLATRYANEARQVSDRASAMILELQKNGVENQQGDRMLRLSLTEYPPEDPMS